VPTLRDHPEQGGDQIIPTAFETPSSAPNAKDLAVNLTGARGTHDDQLVNGKAPLPVHVCEEERGCRGSKLPSWTRLSSPHSAASRPETLAES
jgi:hypothetical protein